MCSAEIESKRGSFSSTKLGGKNGTSSVCFFLPLLLSCIRNVLTESKSRVSECGCLKESESDLFKDGRSFDKGSCVAQPAMAKWKMDLFAIYSNPNIIFWRVFRRISSLRY